MKIIDTYSKLFKCCSFCGSLKHRSKFASNGRGRSKRKSYCHECKYFKMNGSKDIFKIRILEKINIKGMTSFSNCVCACERCNKEKDN